MFSNHPIRSAGLIVALTLALAPSARGQADHPATPTHRDPVVQGVQAHLDRLCEAHDARLACVDGEAALRREISDARAKFLGLLGLDLETPRTPPGVTKVGVLDLPDYTVETLVLDAAPGVPVPCSVYVPKAGPARKPAVLCPHGHSGRDRAVYQNAYQRFAKAGFVVLARDGWGKQERRRTGHGEAGGQLALSNTELMALELFDGIRALDHLAARADVDPEKLVMAGLSGGGSQTLYTAAIEPRLKAASPTCAVTTFRSDLADTTMCVCELAHDVLKVGDHGLFLAMAYPRPLLVVNGRRDPIFPVAGARAAAAQAQRLYAAAGHGDDVAYAEFDAGHEWNDAMLDRQIAWFRRRLGLPELPNPPRGDGPIDERRLGAYPDGDLPATSLTLTEVNRRRLRAAGAGGDTSRRGRTPDADRTRLVEAVRRRWSGEPTPPSRVDRTDPGPDTRSGGPRERLVWPSGLGGNVTVLVTRPPAGGPARPDRVVIHLEDRDRPAPQLERLYWDDRVKPRSVVVALAFTGATLDGNREGQVGSALVASGRSLLAERVRDLLVALEVLRSRGLITDPKQVEVVAHGFDGVVLLAAAPLLPAGVGLTLDRTPITYLAGAEVDFATPRLAAPPYHWTILPGLGLDHDLAELLELAHPHPVLLTHPLDASQVPLSRDAFTSLISRQTRTDHAHVRAVTSEAPRGEVLRRITARALGSPG